MKDAPSACTRRQQAFALPPVMKEFSPIDMSAKVHSCHTGCVADPPSWGVRVIGLYYDP